MKFPNLMNLASYQDLLKGAGCDDLVARDTGRFQGHIELYLKILEMQLGYDALKILDFNRTILAVFGGEMHFAGDLAAQGKLIQGLFVARRKA